MSYTQVERLLSRRIITPNEARRFLRIDGDIPGGDFVEVLPGFIAWQAKQASAAREALGISVYPR